MMRLPWCVHSEDLLDLQVIEKREHAVPYLLRFDDETLLDEQQPNDLSDGFKLLAGGTKPHPSFLPHPALKVGHLDLDVHGFLEAA